MKISKDWEKTQFCCRQSTVMRRNFGKEAKSHKDMEMVTWLEKNGQLCESVFHLPFGEFQDSHESVLKSVEEPLFEHVPLWEAMRSRLRKWKSMAQRLPDGFFQWSLITVPCMPIIFERAAFFFFCLLALSQNLRANMSASMVWSHGLRFHKVMHVGFGMNSVYPGLLGSMGTCQRSAGSLGIRLLILADLSGAQIFHDFSFSQV